MCLKSTALLIFSVDLPLLGPGEKHLKRRIQNKSQVNSSIGIAAVFMRLVAHLRVTVVPPTPNVRKKKKAPQKLQRWLTVDFEVLVLSVFNCYHVQSCPVWKHKPSRFLLMNCGEMGLVIYSPDKDITFWTAHRVTRQAPPCQHFSFSTVTLARVRVWMAMLNFYLGAGIIWGT